MRGRRYPSGRDGCQRMVAKSGCFAPSRAVVWTANGGLDATGLALELAIDVLHARPPPFTRTLEVARSSAHQPAEVLAEAA